MLSEYCRDINVGGVVLGTGTSTQDFGVGLQCLLVAQIYTLSCWGSDINARCGGRDINMGAQIYTLIVGAVASTLGVWAGTLLWLWGHRYAHLLLGQ